VVWKQPDGKSGAMPIQASSQLLWAVFGFILSEYFSNTQVWQTLPAGKGCLALRYRQLRNRLEAEGCLILNARRSPIHPQIIAVVTSPRCCLWGYLKDTWLTLSGLYVLFSPAITRGEQAPELHCGGGWLSK